MFILSGVGAALLMILLYTVGTNIRKLQKPKQPQACDAKVDSEESQ